MKYLLVYENGDLSRAAAHFPEHRARWKQFADKSLLMMVGPVLNSPLFGALGVFVTREAAEEFANGDPFVLNGVVARWSIAEWKEALVNP